MEFNGKTRDAIKLMLHLAMHVESGAIGFSDILERLDFSSERLDRLMWRLFLRRLCSS